MSLKIYILIYLYCFKMYLNLKKDHNIEIINLIKKIISNKYFIITFILIY